MILRFASTKRPFALFSDTKYANIPSKLQTKHNDILFLAVLLTALGTDDAPVTDNA